MSSRLGKFVGSVWGSVKKRFLRKKNKEESSRSRRRDESGPSRSSHKNKSGNSKRPNVDDDDDSESVPDPLLWSKDLEKHYYGNFSFAVVQGNSKIEDYSKVETGPNATFVGVYDGHGGSITSHYIRDNQFLNLMIVRCFRSGFRAAVRDLQGFHIFLLTLHQKLDCLLRAFLIIINKTSPMYEKEETVVPSSPSKAIGGGVHSPSSPGKEHIMNYNHLDSNDTELQKSAPRSSLLNCKESPDSISPTSRDGSHGKFNKGSSEPLRSQRLTAKIRDFNKFAKDDAELNKEWEQWNEMLKNDAIRLCQENNFAIGFF